MKVYFTNYKKAHPVDTAAFNKRCSVHRWWGTKIFNITIWHYQWDFDLGWSLAGKRLPTYG
jgi:hypothetical protein